MGVRLVSLLITLVLIGVLASSVRSKLGSTPRGAPTPETLLREAGEAVERTHQATGTYVGSLQGDSGLRLVSADSAGYCLQLTWTNHVLYHLRGPGGDPAKGGC